MSLDRTPSPQPTGGWSSPGLTTPYEANCVRHFASGSLEGGSSSTSNPISWANAKASSTRVNGLPSWKSQNEGFFERHMRRISSSLPTFMHGGEEDRYELKEKPLRSRLGNFSWRSLSIKNLRSMTWQDWQNVALEVRDLPNKVPKPYATAIKKNRTIIGLLFVFISLLLWFQSELTYAYRRTSWLGGGSKYVIILAANEEGGVMYWKGAREWAIERDSMKNKRRYAETWGYELEIVDMATKKKYAHEWRESWEKADFIRNAMKKYPEAEWFWWLDLNTFIMEPSVSLQQQLFNNLKDRTYRDINLYNPLGISHPPNGTSGDPLAPKFANYLDPISMSPVGDNDPKSINLVISQDCSGFNLGSFFTRRSAWTDRLLDMWWDPVFYEQRHMEWEHKEQDALEYLYTNQPWVRPHVGFVPQRLINAFPNGACGDDRGLPKGGCKGEWDSGENLWDYECGIQGVHYQESARDFMVNFAGCEWGRDCWGEMYNFRQLSNRLNRGLGEKFADFFREGWHDFWHPPPKPEKHNENSQEAQHSENQGDGQGGLEEEPLSGNEKAKEDGPLAEALAVDGVAKDGLLPADKDALLEDKLRSPDALLADLLNPDEARRGGSQLVADDSDKAALDAALQELGEGALPPVKEPKKPIVP